MIPLDHYIQVGQKKLRCGYTTGTCATATALASAMALTQGTAPPVVTVDTPSGIPVDLELLSTERGEDFAISAVLKDSGDDPDITRGARIEGKVSWQNAPGITIQGGQGVGKVTQPGLDQPVGAWAINSVPRAMITQALTPYLPEGDRGFLVEISIPEGETLAKRTFNPRLGILGGLSILGTSGIVRPMSEEALMDSIRLELSILRARGVEHLILTPGNYGEDFSEKVLCLPPDHTALCSNYIGFAIDCGVQQGFSSLLFVGHLGKLSKVAAGTMQTHSKYADPRREVFCTHAALAGGDRALVTALYGCVTADATIPLLQEAGILEETMVSMAKAMEDHLRHRAGEMEIGALFFSNHYGILGQTPGAETLVERHQGKG